LYSFSWKLLLNIIDGTLCRAQSPIPGPTGAGAGTGDVREWDVARKLLEAARRATPKLPAQSRRQFAAILSPANIAITSSVLVAWGASHVIGVGEVADVLFVAVGALSIGQQVVGAAFNIADYASLSVRARTEADLDLAATYLANAVITIGVTTFIALLLKSSRRLAGQSRLSERARATPGEAIESPTGGVGPWWRVSVDGEYWPGTAVPRSFLVESGGQNFRVIPNATKHMAEYAARMPSRGALRNPGVWSISPGARFAEVDYPLSSLAGALEQAALKYRTLPPQRFSLEKFGNWELGIDTRASPWIVEHALPIGK
jgi:membrane protein implicated in regulation of membrane protease activity